MTANIPIINDAIAEDPETFLVIAEPGSSSLTIVINQADSSLMILDNEGEPPTTYVCKLTGADDTCHVFAACLLGFTLITACHQHEGVAIQLTYLVPVYVYLTHMCVTGN